MNKRKQHTEECRQNLINAAIRLISEKGFDKTSVADITSECGMSVGNFYHYFKSKESIVDAIELEPVSKKLESLLSDDSTSASEKLREYLLFYADSDQNLYAVNFRKSLYAHRIKESESGAENKIDLRKKDIEKIIQYGINSGEFSEDLPIEPVSEQIVFSLFGACMYYAMKGSDFDLKGWVDSCFQRTCETLLNPYKA